MNTPAENPDLWRSWEETRRRLKNVVPTTETLYESRVPEYMQGMRLDRYLGIRFKYFSRQRWKEVLAQKRVLVNGQSEKRTYKTKSHDHISFTGEEVVEPPVINELEIVHEDKDLIVFLKPAHLPIHQGGQYLNNTLLQLLKKQMPQLGLKEMPRILHRLDKETSGLIMMSKNIHAHREIYQQFETNSMQKTYLAIVFGKPACHSWIENIPIGKHPASKIGVKLWGVTDGLESQTHFKLLVTSPDEKYSLLEIQPKSGRTNQIRVHAAYAGLPLVGDKTYFPEEEVFLHYQENDYDCFVHEKVLFHRCCLHAWKLNFFHPGLKRPMQLQAPPPQDFLLCLKSLLKGSHDLFALHRIIG